MALNVDWNELLQINDSYQAPEALWLILKNKDKREELFRKSLELHNYKVDYDWFHEYFQDEHADRKVKKQDFTPDSVSKLLTKLIGDAGNSFYEPCAGTGGITIKAWDSDRRNHRPFEFVPSMYFYQLEELSDRAIPFLIFNLAIRGMNATVVHGDVLSRKAKGVFFIQNESDDAFNFSAIYQMPYNDDVKKMFAVKRESKTYEEIDSIPEEFPNHINLKGDADDD